jgi:hypothetical protein
MAAIWVTTRFTTPAAFQRHLRFMEERITGQGMGLGHGGQGGMMADFYQNFQASFNESLVIAFVAHRW